MIHKCFRRFLAAGKVLNMLNFLDSVGTLAGSWWADNRRLGCFLAIDRVLEMLAFIEAVSLLDGIWWAVSQWFGCFLAINKVLDMLDFLDLLGGTWWAVNQWFRRFLAVDEVVDVLDIPCYGWPDVNIVFIATLRQVHSVWEAPEKVEGVAKAILFKWKLLAFAAFEFTQKLAKS